MTDRTQEREGGEEVPEETVEERKKALDKTLVSFMGTLADGFKKKLEAQIGANKEPNNDGEWNCDIVAIKRKRSNKLTLTKKDYLGETIQVLSIDTASPQKEVYKYTCNPSKDCRTFLCVLGGALWTGGQFLYWFVLWFLVFVMVGSAICGARMFISFLSK